MIYAMKNFKVFIVFFILVIFNYSLAQVDSSFPITTSGGSHNFRFLIEDLKNKIPQVLLDEISDQNIIVSFENWGEKNSIFSYDHCKINGDKYILNRRGEEGVAPLVKRNSYLVKKNGNYIKINYIYLNSSLLNYIGNDIDSSVTYSCGHKNFYRLVQALIINELAHIYDAVADPESRGNTLFKSAPCAKIGPNGNENSCSGAIVNNSKVGTSYPFRVLLGWGQNIFKNDNNLEVRSVDLYENKSPAESFAVNLEYFLLDKYFHCHRPAIYYAYQRYFDFDPARASCFYKENYSVYTGMPFRVVTIDPNRIYSIHYLLAARGDDLISMFGHSIFRIIMCAPSRKVVGPDCIKDTRYHLVVSYRANIADAGQSPFKSFMGTYPSRIYFLNFSSVINEYNVVESRDVISIPLKLSRFEINQFIRMALEQYYSYNGTYRTIGNNCSTEAFNLLKGISYSFPKLYKNFFVVTPISLYEHLRDIGMLDTSVLNRKDAIGRYKFEGFFKRVNRALKELKEKTNFPDNVTISKYINLGLEERKKLLDVSLKELNNISKREVVSKFLFLENQILAHFKEDVKGVIEDFLKDPDSVVEKNALEKLLLFRKILSETYPWSLVKDNSISYGIPLYYEKISSKQLDIRMDKLNKIIDELRAILTENNQELLIKRKNISKNIKYFVNLLK